MSGRPDDGVGRPRTLPELVTRALRHEVGDFLQSVYATAALLQARLPAEAALERQLTMDLRARGEGVRQVLDGVFTLVCQGPHNPGPVDLAAVARETAAAVAARQPAVRVQVEAPGPLPAQGDARLLHQAATLLILAACRAARQTVTVRAAPAGPGAAEWVVWHDGPPPPPEQRGWLDRPFASTHNLLQGLALGVTRLAAERHGGRAELPDPPGGGFTVRLVLPAEV
jgi:signal transduction histidine kinase